MKKMRRLIPAIAMLLVSAVMLSTASFAWFTMNDQVAATGMQVQAKASGNLIIGTSKLTATSSGISVDFGGTKQNLTPITHVDGEGWFDANGVEVDPIYGTTAEDADLTSVTVTAEADEHFSEYIVYLATAGEEEIVGNLTFDLDALVNAEVAIAPAYTVALWIVEDDETIDDVDWDAPDAKLNQLENKGSKSGFVDTGVEVTVPSTYGKVAETAVGLMVIIRVYVDGALPIEGGVPVADTKRIQAVGNLTYDETDMANWVFYADAAGTVVYDKALLQQGQVLSTVVGYYWDGAAYDQHENAPATYVNNTSVPAAGTSFAIDFKIAE